MIILLVSPHFSDLAGKGKRSYLLRWTWFKMWLQR